ncbi:MAG: aminotransferase class V-fold PLP-dependent enzyme [Holosporaceae bacterium]|jgi:phosphoserine aminotransferase|nr:aminotransferase class V-fold PLP-dependent enzyme [Holosporaceae bacterium]
MEKPSRVNFSSGPCAKRRSWAPPSGRFVGRSHRSADGLQLIRDILSLQRKVLDIPDEYYIGMVGASTTGAMETLMWSLLGARGVDIISLCIFSKHWENDIANELRLRDVRAFRAEFPNIADTGNVDFNRDVVFCWTSTTSGASFKDANWIEADRSGLTICDAASAAFALELDWRKFDATAFSWQKGLGGEAGFGTVVLGPRAISRLESHKPNHAIPRIFRIAENKVVNYAIFDGFCINTPSMLCLEDFYENLIWADELGGIKALTKKVQRNNEIVKKWISEQDTFKFLVDEKYRAPHIACFDVASRAGLSMSDDEKLTFLKKIVKFCEEEAVGFDFLGHTLTKPHLRVWCGPTIEADDLEKFLPWICYAHDRVIGK